MFSLHSSRRTSSTASLTIFMPEFDSQNFPSLVAVGLNILPIFGPPKLCHAINSAMTGLSGIAVKLKS